MRDDLGNDDVAKAILCSSNKHKLIKLIFSSTLKCWKRDKINFIYLNQISGFIFKTWLTNSSIVEFDEKQYHQIGSGPDCWLTRGWVNPKAEKAINIYTALSILKRRNDLFVKSGANIFGRGQLKIIQSPGKKVVFVHSSRQPRRGRRMWMSLPTLPLGYQDFSLISHKQKENGW